MSGDHGYGPLGLADPNPAVAWECGAILELRMEAVVAEITELQEELARLRAEDERLRAVLQDTEGVANRLP